MALAYEAKYVFDHIRGFWIKIHEWKDLPREENESDESWNRRGQYFASLKRIEANKEFFECAWKLQPPFMAVFGPDTEKT